VSELIWKPLGAERSAYITVDRLGAPRCAGGLCATVRDLARVGRLIAEDGASRSAQIVPEACIRDILRNGDPHAWASGDLASYFPGAPMRYRSQWYVHDVRVPAVFGLGIHGQYLLVDRRHEIIIAKVPSQAFPVDLQRGLLTLRAVSRIVGFLAASSA
jgi:hypothetical protein